jgi:hypothetical protein
MKLQKIVPATTAKHKYTAIFDLGEGKQKKVHFGAKGYADFILTGDETKKASYLARHGATEEWTDPLRPSTLSRYILWNRKTLNESIKDFRHRFNV